MDRRMQRSVWTISHLVVKRTFLRHELNKFRRTKATSNNEFYDWNAKRNFLLFPNRSCSKHGCRVKWYFLFCRCVIRNLKDIREIRNRERDSWISQYKLLYSEEFDEKEKRDVTWISKTFLAYASIIWSYRLYTVEYIYTYDAHQLALNVQQN